MPQWHIWLGRIARRIWFRAALISVLSVMLALASAGLAPFIPYEFSLKIGSDSVDSILTILASSMLAVTTFSLTAMVAAFSRAAQQVTPRATQLLIEDKTAQNALSTFLGAFLFGIVGIIALSTDMYGAQGRVILYIGTILLIAWIAFILLRWIHALTQFGRVEDAIHRIEQAAIKAIDRRRPILLAGQPDLSAPPGAAIVPSPTTGYVTIIDRRTLKRCAEEAAVGVTICAPTGQMVSRGQALAWTSEPVNDRCKQAMAAAFAVDDERTFDEDPRFGMVVLAEIGSRALSAAVNDPGTAIAALNAGQRVMEALADAAASRPKEPGLPLEPPLALEALAEDLVLPLARDAATTAEVGIRLQQMLGAIAGEVPPAADAMRRLADDAIDRVRRAENAPTDVERIERARLGAFAMA